MDANSFFTDRELAALLAKHTDTNAAQLRASNGTELLFEGMVAKGDVRGLCLEMSVEQRFRNPGDDHLEVVYSFPLPWRAVLLGVEVLLGGKRLSGSVSQKAVAIQKYEDTIADGDAAIMLECNHDESYTLNLGNLAAHEPCVVTIRYAQTLAFEQGGLRLLIPTTIAPRYGDMVRDGGLQPHQAPTHDLLAEYGFDISLNLHGVMARARIASPSHPVSVLVKVAYTVVSLARQAHLDRDFILVLDELAQTSAAVAGPDFVDPAQTAFMASFQIRLPSDTNQMVAAKILVDCSGSMGGDSMDSARRALQMILGQFVAGDRFSLSKFGSDVAHRSRALWKATDATRMAGQRWVDTLDADMGGTEMEGALASTFALAHTGPCDVLLVTDGEIAAINATIKAAKASGHRLFVVGIGSSPAEVHLRRLAGETGGACDFVAPGEAVQPAVVRMFHRLRSARVERLTLEWPPGCKPLWHSTLDGAVFDGDTLNVLARFETAPAGDVRLLGTSAQTPGEVPVRIAAVVVGGLEQDGGTLSRLVASRQVEALGEIQGRAKAASKARAQAQKMALAYQLVTAHTNFLLTLQREEGQRAQSLPRLHKVSQMVAAGHAGFGSVAGSIAYSRHLPVSSSVSPLAVGDLSPMFDIGGPAELDAFEEPVFCCKEGADTALGGHPPEVRIPAEMLFVESVAYTGLSPLGLVQWLCDNRHDEWPSTFAALRGVGIGSELVDWLELVIGDGLAEAEVVAAFLDAVIASALAWAEAADAAIARTAQEFLRLQGHRLRADHEAAVHAGQASPSVQLRNGLLSDGMLRWNVEAFGAVLALQDG